jgi:hypothetical protein
MTAEQQQLPDSALNPDQYVDCCLCDRPVLIGEQAPADRERDWMCGPCAVAIVPLRRTEDVPTRGYL